MRKSLFLLLVVVALALPGGTMAQDDAAISIIFMHHSTGAGLIYEGDVRPALGDLGYEFWDHGYNEEGLVDPQGNHTGTNWDVPGDNTDPDGWYNIFQQPVTDPPTNTFSHMLQHDVIIFKSCFPSSHIYDDDMFATYQQYFLAMRDVMDQHPDKLFIPFTTPPLVPNETDAEAAARARRWSEYLTSDEYLEGHPNIAVFDFFTHLADDDGYLRAEYRSDEWDSHPNDVANQAVGPIFVEFIDQAVRDFNPSEVPPVPSEDDDDPVVTATDKVFAEDFENSDFDQSWYEWHDEGGTFVCGLAEEGLSDSTALRIEYDLPVDVYGGCGTGLPMPQDWSAASGINFQWRASVADQRVNVLVFVDDPTGEPTPFQVELITPGPQWETVSLTWDQFIKPDWIGDAGVDRFDTTAIVGLSFDLGTWDTAMSGSIWIDEIMIE